MWLDEVIFGLVQFIICKTNINSVIDISQLSIMMFGFVSPLIWGVHAYTFREQRGVLRAGLKKVRNFLKEYVQWLLQITINVIVNGRLRQKTPHHLASKFYSFLKNFWERIIKTPICVNWTTPRPHPSSIVDDGQSVLYQLFLELCPLMSKVNYSIDGMQYSVGMNLSKSGQGKAEDVGNTY